MTEGLEIPPPGYPMLVLLITDNFLPKEDSNLPLEIRNASTLQWMVGKPHPYVAKMNVERMFVSQGGGVDVYSISEDRRTCMRNAVWPRRVRCAQELMPPAVFVEEIRAAENGDDEDDPDDGEGDTEPDLEGVTTSVGGQTAP